MKVFEDPFDPHWVPPRIDVKEVRKRMGAVQDISELSDDKVIQLEKELQMLAAIAHELSFEEDIERLSDSNASCGSNTSKG